MDAFPAFVPLNGARVVVAGEGEAAEAKARLFETSPADLVRLQGEAALDPDAYARARLVFVAGDGAWLEAAVSAARTQGAWVNVVDQPAACDFTTPGIIDRGRVVGAVGTCGLAPVLASSLRADIEARWPARLEGLAELLAALRPDIRRARTDSGARRGLLSALIRGPWADAALAGEAAQAQRLGREALEAGTLQTRPGALNLIATPPAPDLLTMRALRLLGAADRLVLASAVPRDLLDLARRDAPRVPWPQELEPLLAWRDAGETVVILGDVEGVRAQLSLRGVEVESA